MTIEWNFILRIFAAGILGGLIGFEREFRAKEAGVRTHFIVALGSALFMIISQYAFSGRFDAARVAAQVVSGIGFIGAGVIIFQKNVAGLASLDRDGLQSQEADFDQRARRRDVQCPLTVQIRLHTVAGTHLDNSSPDHRTELVFHDALGSVLREGGGRRQGQDREQSENLLHINCFRLKLYIG